jgi:O-antigen ligase
MKKFPVFLEYLLLSTIALIIILSPYYRTQIKILSFLAFGVWIALKIIQARSPGKNHGSSPNPLARPLIIFGCSCILSVILSHYPYHSQKIFMNRFMMYGLFFLVGLDLAGTSRKNFYWLIGATLFSGGLLALGGIRDYLIFHPNRLFTSFGKEIPFAMLPLFITYFFPFNFAVFVFSENKILRVFSAMNLILLLPCVLWQGSRAAWVAIAVSVLIIAVIKSRKVFASILVVILVIFSSGLFFAPIRQKLQSIPHPSQWNFRTPLYESAWKMFRDHPVAGAGLGMYEKLIKEPRYSLPADYPNHDRSIYLHAHNVYLEVLAEAGIIGLAAFIYFFLAYFIKIILSLKAIKSQDHLGFVVGITGLALATLISGVAGSIITVGINETFMFWLLLGSSIGLLPKVPKERTNKNG